MVSNFSKNSSTLFCDNFAEFPEFPELVVMALIAEGGLPTLLGLDEVFFKDWFSSLNAAFIDFNLYLFQILIRITHRFR